MTMTEATAAGISPALTVPVRRTPPQAISDVPSTSIGVQTGFVGTFDDVLRRAQSGDGQAFADIDRVLGGRIMAFIASRGVEDPGGLTNEVFLGAFRSIDSFSGNEAAFVGWVFRIARNKIIDEHRYRKRRPETVVASSVEHKFLEPSAEDAALADVELSEAFALLDGLTEDQREIVLMRVVSGLSFAEIGQSLGKRTGAIKAAYRRAIKTAGRAATR